MGLKDQIAALRWVRKYISHFGGDPERVTLAGESAGAHAVATIVANTNEPLFQKVIVQSAPYKVGAKDSDAQKTYNYIREILGKDPKEATAIPFSSQNSLQIHQNRPRDVPSAGSFIVIDVDPLKLEIRRGVAVVPPRGVHAVLVADHFPELGPDLVPTLASLDVKDFSHRRSREEKVRVWLWWFCV